MKEESHCLQAWESSIALAVWSRNWWGCWAIIPIGLVLIWMWLNPRLFAKPASTNNWASKWLYKDMKETTSEYRSWLY